MDKWTKDLQLIYEEFLPRYKEKLKGFQEIKLKQLILKSREEAEENYSKLSLPKIISFELYVSHWIRATVDKYFASRTVRKISFKNPPKEFKNSVVFVSLIQHPKIQKLKKDFYDQFPERPGIVNRNKEIWKESKLPFKEIEKTFVETVKERNITAKKQGFCTQAEMAVVRNRISPEAFEIFVKQVDKNIDYCNQQLPKLGKLPSDFFTSWGSHCFLCQLPFFEFVTLDEVFEYMTNQSKLLNKFKEKIKITFGKNSKMNYRKESDTFEITIEEVQNLRHKSVDLIHELCHVINFLEDLHLNKDPFNKGDYINEKEELETELPILKDLSFSIYRSAFGNFLKIFHSVLFQIELYKNPNQDLSKLYAKTFNKCFKGAKQKTNPTYILDNSITLEPFNNLSYAVAQVSAITHLLLASHAQGR